MLRNGEIADLQAAQGWSDATLLNLVLEFVATFGDEEHLEKWLGLRAAAENRESQG